MSICYRADCPGMGCPGGGDGCPVTENRLDEEVATERTCGACSLCCKVMPMDTSNDTISIVTLDGELCRFCKEGTNKPCTIYEARPRVCRGFICGWLAGVLDDHWKPSDCGLVLSAAAGQGEPVAVWCEKGHKNWKASPWWSDLLRIAANALEKSGKFTVVYPPEYRSHKDRYCVIDPIARNVLAIHPDELVVLLMGMQYFRIKEKNVEKWRGDLTRITADFGCLPKEASAQQMAEARLSGMKTAVTLGWEFEFNERRICLK